MQHGPRLNVTWTPSKTMQHGPRLNVTMQHGPRLKCYYVLCNMDPV